MAIVCQFLLGVQLDDQLFIDGFGNLAPFRQAGELAGALGSVPFKPGILAGGGVQAVLNDFQALGTLADAHDAAGFHDARRNVADRTVDSSTRG